jgi:hypothetical protein
MSEKKIETLVPDIYALLDQGKKEPDKAALFELGYTVMEVVRKQLWFSTAERKPALRMSNLGKPCDRALWMDIKGDHEPEPLTPETRLKFLFGDLVEALVLYLAKEAGHSVEDQQKRIEVDGIVGHIDAVIDGHLVDVKSASSFAMKKFRNGTLPDDDAFGYISQISGYANAMGKKSGTFLAMDKSSGDLVTYTHKDLEDTSARIKHVKAMLESDTPPDRPFKEVDDKQSGRKKLDINCSYCPHKQVCWADKGLDLKFRAGRPIFLVGNEGKTKEEIEHGF